jgi:hypothetical protein
MSEQKSPSHWDTLASTLGAKPSHREAAKQPSPPPPPAAAPPPHPRKSTPTPRPTAGWDTLASEFGIAGSPPTAEPPAVIAATPSAAVPAPETPEESPNFFDERFDFEEPFDLLEGGETPAPATDAAKPSTESSERRPRKRRRRRGGRKGERRDFGESNISTAADVQPTEAIIDEPDVEQREQKRREREPSVEQRELKGREREPSDVEESGETQERRSRRERPRRGRKRRESPSGEPRSKREEGEPVGEDLFDEDLHEPHEGDDGHSARIGFRGIPTWGEVVGLLIDKNIEAKSKRPADSRHQGRGSRGRRDKRGGKPRS